MTYESPGAAAFRQRLLTSPGERGDVEYKPSLPFNRDDRFSLNLIREVHGMANAGGGWLVLGFMDTDQGIVLDPNYTEQICSSYEPTKFSQQVDSTVQRGQRVELTAFATALIAQRLISG